MSALEPGKVYMATVNGFVNEIVLVDEEGVGHLGRRSKGGTWHAEADDIADARPLIVLDLVSSQVDYLRHALNRWIEWSSLTDEKRTLAGLLGQIEAQTKPARIPEPSLWGVAEASIAGQRIRQCYIRDNLKVNVGGGWVSIYGPPETDTRRVEWSDLIDPTLIRDGVA